MFSTICSVLKNNTINLFIYIFCCSVFNYLLFAILFVCAHGTQFPMAEILRKEGVWKCHDADLEIWNMSARQAALNCWAVTDKR